MSYKLDKQNKPYIDGDFFFLLIYWLFNTTWMEENVALHVLK